MAGDGVAARGVERFGASSFVVAVVMMFVNVVPVAVLPLLLVFAAVLYGLEVVVGVVLWAVGGAARRVASGIAVAVGATTLLFAVAMVVTFAREHW